MRNQIKRIGVLGGIGISLALICGCTAENRFPIAPQKDLRDRIGICHINGFYQFTDQDYLNEGADRILELGSRTIKLVIRDKLETYYPFHMNWPEIHSLVEAAETPYFQQVFAKPFQTYVLMAFTPGDRHILYFTNGMTPEDIQREQDSFYEFTKYLLTKYRGTGKTFIFQNWEGDWVLTPAPDENKTADPVAIRGSIDWLNARQDGVDRARAEVGMDGVWVMHATELNRVFKAISGRPSMANDVLPYTHCDLYSYSAYEAMDKDAATFRKVLDYIKEKAPDSEFYGADNIFLGEFGWPETYGGEDNRMRIIKEKLQTAFDFGVQYVCVWDLYCDVVVKPYEGRPQNENMVGHWLIRPDGTKTALWDYLTEVFQQNYLPRGL